jgi:hypothetical protein
MEVEGRGREREAEKVKYEGEKCYEKEEKL